MATISTNITQRKLKKEDIGLNITEKVNGLFKNNYKTQVNG